MGVKENVRQKAESLYCGKCGKKTSGGQYCSGCGNQLTDKAKPLGQEIVFQERIKKARTIGQVAYSDQRKEVDFFEDNQATKKICTTSYEQFSLSVKYSHHFTQGNQEMVLFTVVRKSSTPDTVDVILSNDHFSQLKKEISSALKNDIAQIQENLPDFAYVEAQKVDSGLPTFSMKGENSDFQDIGLGDFSKVNVPKSMANILKQAVYAHEHDYEGDLLQGVGKTLTIAGHTFAQGAILYTLRHVGDLHPYRVERQQPKLSPQGAETHYVYLPIYDTSNQLVLLSITQKMYADILNLFSDKIDNPEERTFVDSALTINKHKTHGGASALTAEGTISFNNLLRVKVEGGTTRGERQTNQDVWIAQKVLMKDGTELAVLKIYDGMGGGAAGERASKIGATSELSFLRDLTIEQINGLKDSAIRLGVSYEMLLMDSAMKYVALQAHSQIGPDSGATTTGGWVINGKFVAANRGDSRTYVFRNGSMVLKTVDHSLVQRLVAAGQITEEDAATHEQAHVIYQYAVGEKEGKIKNTFAYSPLQEDPFNIAEVPLESGDVIMAMCDGVVGGLQHQQKDVPQSLQSLLDLPGGQRAIEAIDQFAIGGGDNDSFICADVYFA